MGKLTLGFIAEVQVSARGALRQPGLAPSRDHRLVQSDDDQCVVRVWRRFAPSHLRHPVGTTRPDVPSIEATRGPAAVRKSLVVGVMSSLKILDEPARVRRGDVWRERIYDVPRRQPSPQSAARRSTSLV